MKWIKSFLGLVLVLCFILIALLQIGSAYMRYDTEDILEALPTAVIEYPKFDNVIVRTVHIDNRSDTLIVFVHGAPGSFDAFLPYLADSNLQSYNLLAYDRPGYGESSSSPMPSIIDQSKILLNIINTYPTNHIVLVGHSYGGPIAGYAAAVYPNVIDNTVLIAPLLDPEHEPIFWFSYFAKWPLTRWVLTHDLRTSGIEKFQHSEALKEIEPFWQKLQRPVLHIHGSEDMLAPPTHNTDYSNHMIDSNYLDVKLYPEEGHMILWDKFEMTKELIIDFIQ